MAAAGGVPDGGAATTPNASAAPTPVEAVAAHAGATPEQPALVFPTPAGTWRWSSWSWLAARVAARAEELRAWQAGTLLEYPWLPSPGGVVTDLAIQAAGCIALPRPAADLEGEALGAAARPAELPPNTPPPVPLERWEDQPAAAPWGTLPERPPPAAGALLAAAVRQGGGAAVASAAGWQVWSARELGVAAAALHRCLATAERPLALIGGDLAAAAERAWLAWAIVAGAVLVLPGDPQLFAWALAWSRPTHVCLRAADLGPLRAALGELDEPRALRRRLRRLGHLVATGEDVPAAERQAWAELGVTPAAWPATVGV